MAEFKGVPRELLLEWIERHHAALFRFAYRLSGSHQDAEDLVHDAFLTVATAKAGPRDPDLARGWLFSILRNAFLMRLRKQRGNQFELLTEDLPDSGTTLDTGGSGPDVELLQRLLNQMPEAYRTPLILFFFEEFSYKEIADQMRVPIGTVMSRLARAKDWIRQRFPWPAEGLGHKGLERENDGRKVEIRGV